MNLFRTGWDLLYWNFRKAGFRRRGSRGRAPCQHPSDSGEALETGCAACRSWKNPAQFKKICPLLVETGHGLRCSVDAKDVRPFWKPVLVFYGRVAGASYLLVLFAVFGALKFSGSPVRIVDLAWPGFWHKIPQARHALLSEKARRALAAGNVREALLYLQTAQEADPRNYDVGLDLALLYATALPANSSAQFDRLMAEHPEKRNETALRWLDALVVHADFPNLSGLAAMQLKADPAHANTWAKALFFSTRQLKNAPALKLLAADPDPALDPWRDSLRLEIALEENDQTAAEVLLHKTWEPGAPAYVRFHKLRTLAQIDGGLTGLDAIQQYAAELDPATKLILVLDILSELKLTTRLASQVDMLLARQKNADTIKMLCAHVIRYQDRATFDRAYAAAQLTDPLRADRGLWFSLLVAAGAAGDNAAVQEMAKQLGARPEARAIALELRDFFDGESNRASFSGFLPWLGLPLEENYALLENPPVPIRRAGRDR